MILLWIIIIPLLGGLLAWLSGRWSQLWPRWVSLISLAVQMALFLIILTEHFGEIQISGRPWLVQFDQPWISKLGIHVNLAMDGLSLLLVLMTNFLGIMAVACSWTAIKDRVGFFHFNLMWTLAGITGVFLAIDLFLFYFFWEMMLVPLYFLIGIWGYENRVYSAVKFFIFTQASGLLMLVGILGLYFIHGRNTGIYTFDYMQLLGTTLSETTARLFMFCFFIAFAVKLPVIPFHTWLPDAHTEAPTAGSVDLAGLVLKVGAYGMLRFLIPLFPKVASDFSPIAMTLAVVGILYGAILAFGQTDLKRLVAYTSISHMGFVFLGIFTWNTLALQGAVMVILAHGISIGALFILVGVIHERIHTRDMNRMGGLWATAPRMGGVGLLFALASLGLPGLGNFIGEVLVLIGAYQVSIPLAVFAGIGLITSTIYSLWMIQQTFHGPNREGWKVSDLTGREIAMMTAMIAVVVWLGLYPQPVLNTARESLNNLQQIVKKELVAEYSEGFISVKTGAP
ncbi:MAG: NADH-quinone oxidoreductase subunit M [Nitrospirota bacterium]